MASNAMTQDSDSQIPPLKCSPDERPPVIFTQAGILAMRDAAPTLAIAEPFEPGKYYCPFCNSECSRDFCWGCKSNLLESDQDDQDDQQRFIDANEPL